MSPTELELIDAFDRELLRRSSTSFVPFSCGTAYLNEDFPLRWDSNFLFVEPTASPTAAAELAAEADRILGGAGLAHREVFVPDDAAGERLAPGFGALRWAADHLVVMAHHLPSERSATGVEVREVPFLDARPVREATVRREPYGTNEEVVRQLVDHRALFERVAGARFFVGRVDGADAGVCEAYVIGEVAQIEDVNTLEEHRRRGVATAVVTAAAAACRAAGARVVFLIADDKDWPKHLYVALGFEPVARRWSFLRVPD